MDNLNLGNSNVVASESDAKQSGKISPKSAFREDSLKNLVNMCSQSTHQLNNRLTTILANTQLALLMLKDESLRRYLKAVEDAAREAGVIVKSFQESARLITKSYSQTDSQESVTAFQK